MSFPKKDLFQKLFGLDFCVLRSERCTFAALKNMTDFFGVIYVEIFLLSLIVVSSCLVRGTIQHSGQLFSALSGRANALPARQP